MCMDNGNLVQFKLIFVDDIFVSVCFFAKCYDFYRLTRFLQRVLLHETIIHFLTGGSERKQINVVQFFLFPAQISEGFSLCSRRKTGEKRRESGD